MDLRRGWWYFCGTVLVLVHVRLAALATHFDYAKPLEAYPTLALLGWSLAAGALWFSLWPCLSNRGLTRRPLLFLVGAGLCMRALMFFSTPMLEDDVYRYLWDGAVVMHGENPYRYAPAEVEAANTGEVTSVSSTLVGLANAPGAVLDKITPTFHKLQSRALG